MELKKLDPEDFVMVFTTAMFLDLMITNHRSWPENPLYIHSVKAGNRELYQKARQGIAMNCVSAAI